MDEPQSEASQSSEKQKRKKTPLNDNATTPIRNIGHNAMASSSATKIVGNDTNDDVKKNKIKLSVIPEEMVQTSQLVKENNQRITKSGQGIVNNNNSRVSISKTFSDVSSNTISDVTSNKTSNKGMPKIPINDDGNDKLVRKVTHEAKKVAKNKIVAKKKGKNRKKVNYKEFQFSDNDDESEDSRGLLAFLKEDVKKRKEI